MSVTTDPSWSLGITSSHFESGGDPGRVSTGKGDHGGVSYGRYQLSSAMGTVDKYLAFSHYADRFEGLKPGTEAFSERWKEVAASEPGFGQDQHDFIKASHYDKQVSAMAGTRVDLSDRGAAVQDAIWSTAVQYNTRTPELFERGLKEAYGPNYDASKLTDEQIITAVQDSKLRHVDEDFASSSQKIRDGVRSRISSEKADLLTLAETGIPATHRGAPHQSGSLRQGASGERVRALQGELAELGYTAANGNPLVADKSFGPSTKHALIEFQKASGLEPDGVAGPATLAALKAQVAAHKDQAPSGQEPTGQSPSAPASRDPATKEQPAAKLLSDPTHEDYAFFQKTRALVHDMDREHGRQPDGRSDNLASCLVVRGKADGLERIDHIALSDDASRVWGVQTPDGRNDHLFDLRTSVPTVASLNTPMAQSASQWPQAAEKFQEQAAQREQVPAQVMHEQRVV